MGRRPFFAHPLYRAISASVGLALVLCGAWLLTADDWTSAQRFLGAGVVVILGANFLWSAIRAKEPWASKLGPLP